MYVLQLTSAISVREAPLITSWVFGVAGVALYQAGAKLSQVVRPVILTLSTQIHPLTTRFHVLNEGEKQRKTLILGTRYTLLLGVVFSAGIILFAERFCRLWLFEVLGNDYMTVVKVMRLWALVGIVNEYAIAMHWPVLLGKKKLSFALDVQVPSSILNILGSIYLVGFTDWGIPGTLVATIIIALIRGPIVIWYVSKITDLSVKEYIRSAYVPSGILFILLLAFYYILRLFPAQSWAMMVICLASFGVYSALILLVIERQLMVSLWRQWSRK
jgi:O-antigen/teichoic acid export membrane protein